MPKRVLLSFKDNKEEEELLKFLDEQSILIGRSSYMKTLLKKEKDKKELLLKEDN